MIGFSSIDFEKKFLIHFCAASTGDQQVEDL